MTDMPDLGRLPDRMHIDGAGRDARDATARL